MQKLSLVTLVALLFSATAFSAQPMGCGISCAFPGNKDCPVPQVCVDPGCCLFDHPYVAGHLSNDGYCSNDELAKGQACWFASPINDTTLYLNGCVSNLNLNLCWTSKNQCLLSSGNEGDICMNCGTVGPFVPGHPPQGSTCSSGFECSFSNGISQPGTCVKQSSALSSKLGSQAPIAAAPKKLAMPKALVAAPKKLIEPKKLAAPKK